MAEIPLNPDDTPAPLLGCLVCHAEGTLTLASPPAWQFWQKKPLLTCSECGSVALFDFASAEEWSIRYRSIPARYSFANLKFKTAGWISADDALELSTQIYIQRQCLRQLERGDLSWLKPQRLTPPPPLMTPEELVYLTLKPVTYVEVLPQRLNRPKDVILDSGTCYITDGKIHLLGQQRDRSHRLTEIERLSHQGENWSVELRIGDRIYAYRGLELANYDAELIIAVVQALQAKVG